MPPILRGILHGVPPDQRLAIWKTFVAPLRWHATRTFIATTQYGFKMDSPLIDMLSLYVYYFGVWEPNLTAWISRQLSVGDVFVDVGANLGYYSLLASRIVGESGKVIAIEASPRIVPKLRNNLQINMVHNVLLENIAVSNHEGEIDLYYGPISHSGITSIVQQEGLVFGTTTRAKPLPAIITRDDFTKTRLFKIDVEGAEWFVVEGLRDFLTVTRSDAEFVIEISPTRLNAFGKTADDVINVFKAAGFNAYTALNNYSPEYYLSKALPDPPIRVNGPVTSESDIVFSRRDEAQL